jgi:hypothetical protein
MKDTCSFLDQDYNFMAWDKNDQILQLWPEKMRSVVGLNAWTEESTHDFWSNVIDPSKETCIAQHQWFH